MVFLIKAVAALALAGWWSQAVGRVCLNAKVPDWVKGGVVVPWALALVWWMALGAREVLG